MKIYIYKISQHVIWHQYSRSVKL